MNEEKLPLPLAPPESFFVFAVGNCEGKGKIVC